SFNDAFNIVKSIFFDNSNALYNLKLPFPHTQEAAVSETPAPSETIASTSIQKASSTATHDGGRLVEPLLPLGMQYLRIQWVDYTGSLRLRVLPLSAVKKLLRKPNFDVRVTMACLSLLQDDTTTESTNPSGMLRLQPLWSTS